MKTKILSKKQLAEKLGLWRREEIDYEYKKQFREKVKVVGIIRRETISV